MNTSEFLDRVRIGAQLAVGEQPKCPPGYCARLATCPDRLCPGHPAPDDEPLTTPEQAESWTATTGYTLIAALAGVLFLIFLVVLYMATRAN